MKNPVHLLFAAAGLALAAPASAGNETSWQFSAYVIENGRTRFALREGEAGAATWLELGQSFQGYVLRSFSKETDTLLLSKSGAELKLRLNPERPKAAATPLSAETEEKILKNLRLLAAAADQYFVERKVPPSSYDELVGPEKYVRQDPTPVAGEVYRTINFSAAKMEVFTSSGHTVSYLR